MVAVVDVAVAGLHFADALLPKPALLMHYSILDCHCLVFVAYCNYCNDHPYSSYTSDTGKKTPSLQYNHDHIKHNYGFYHNNDNTQYNSSIKFFWINFNSSINYNWRCR